MASSLKISYAQIPFNSVSITPSVAADVNNNEWNLVAGPRYQRFFYGSAATSRSTVYDLGTAYASKNSTVDHIILARADFLKADGTTDIVLASSPDNSTWTNRVAISNIANTTLEGPRAKDLTLQGGPPAIAGCTAWYDSEKGVTKDGSNLVSQWNDFSGNARHATQGTGANQPLWNSAAINGSDSISYSGSPKTMSQGAAQSSFFGASAKTAFAVIKPSSVTGQQKIYAGINGYHQLEMSGTTLRAANWDGNQDYATYGTPLAIGSVYVISMVHDGVNLSIGVNGGSLTSTASGATSNLADTQYLASDSSANYFTGHIAEIAFFNVALGTTDRQTIENYLIAKWQTVPAKINAIESPQVRYWRVTYSGSSQVYRHSKCYFGKFFTFDYDPEYEIDMIAADQSYWYAASGAAHFVRPEEPIYRIRLKATACTDTTVKSFEDNIARYAHRTPVFLYDVAVPAVLNNVSPIHAWLTDYSVEKIAYNYNQITATFEEAIG